MSQKILGQTIVGALVLLYPTAAQAQINTDSLRAVALDLETSPQDVLAMVKTSPLHTEGHSPRKIAAADIGDKINAEPQPAIAAPEWIFQPDSIQAFQHTRVTNGSTAQKLIESRRNNADNSDAKSSQNDGAAERIALAEGNQPNEKPKDSNVTDGDVGSLASSGADALRRKLLIKPLALAPQPVYAPGSTAGGPSAFGAQFGDAFTGLSFSSGRPSKAVKQEADGAVSTGFGIGDARRAVGLEVNVSGGSIRQFGANGDVGLKLHRNLPGNAAIAVGWDSGITWGRENRNTVSTLYGVVTKAFPLKPGNRSNAMPLTVSLGVGGGRFRSFDSIAQGRNTVGVFGSVGLQVAPQASLVSTWTGRDLNLGVSFVPIKSTPLFVTAVAANVLGNNDQNRLFSLSLGYGFNYSGMFR